MAAVAKGLVQNGDEVHILALNTAKHQVEIAKLPGEILETYHLQAVDIDNNISPWNAFSNLVLSKAPFHVSRFVSKAFESALRNMLEKHRFDLVVFESLFVAPYLSVVKAHKVPCVLRSHNVEYRIWERVIAQTPNGMKKRYIQVQKERLRKYEARVTPRFDAIAAISPRDAEAYQKDLQWHQKVAVVPFGIEARPYQSKAVEPGKWRLGFVGTMSWLPNAEGIRWFLREVWPSIKMAFPEVSCCIGGYHMPVDIMELADEQLRVLGAIEDVDGFYASTDIVLAPLLSGGGVRIKILEAMAKGLPVLATPIGYEGIQAQDGKDMMEFTNAQSALAHLHKAMAEENYLPRIAAEAHQLIQRDFSPKIAAQKLVELA